LLRVYCLILPLNIFVSYHLIVATLGRIAKPKTMTIMKDISLIKGLGNAKGQAVTLSEKSVTKMQDFQDDEGMFAYSKEPEILKNVQRLIGNDVYSIHTMYINKPSDLGTGSSRHPPHQDLLYFPIRPAHLICGAWTALQNITKENGCLYVVPGTHAKPLLKHEYPQDMVNNKSYFGIQGVNPDSMRNVEMEAGDTLYFHPLLIHGSGANLSKEFRKAVSTHYAAGQCIEVDGDVLEDPTSKEIQEMFAKKLDFRVSYFDVWRLKSVHVAGQKSATIDASLVQKPTMSRK